MLYLLPNLLDENADHDLFFPRSVQQIIPQLDGFIFETPKKGRKFLKRFIQNIQDIPMRVLNVHTTSEEMHLLTIPMQKGEKWGLLADIGLPILADPGAALVLCLQKLHIPVHTFPGPSSIIYALQLSGLSAQSFTFHGYLPRKDEELRLFLHALPGGYTHLCIEPPYRTDLLLKKLITYLPNSAYLSAAWNLTLPTQGVLTKKVAHWKKTPHFLGKVPAIFLFNTK